MRHKSPHIMGLWNLPLLAILSGYLQQLSSKAEFGELSDNLECLCVPPIEKMSVKRILTLQGITFCCNLYILKFSRSYWVCVGVPESSIKPTIYGSSLVQ